MLQKSLQSWEICQVSILVLILVFHNLNKNRQNGEIIYFILESILCYVVDYQGEKDSFCFGCFFLILAAVSPFNAIIWGLQLYL